MENESNFDRAVRFTCEALNPAADAYDLLMQFEYNRNDFISEFFENEDFWESIHECVGDYYDLEQIRKFLQRRAALSLKNTNFLLAWMNPSIIGKEFQDFLMDHNIEEFMEPEDSWDFFVALFLINPAGASSFDDMVSWVGLCDNLCTRVALKIVDVLKTIPGEETREKPSKIMQVLLDSFATLDMRYAAYLQHHMGMSVLLHDVDMKYWDNDYYRYLEDKDSESYITPLGENFQAVFSPKYRGNDTRENGLVSLIIATFSAINDRLFSSATSNCLETYVAELLLLREVARRASVVLDEHPLALLV